MKLKALAILPLAIALVGCGGGDDPAADLTPDQVQANAKLEKEANEAKPEELAVNPNVDAEGAAPVPGAPAAEIDGSNADLAGMDKATDDEGNAKTLSIQEALQNAVENYDRMANASVIEPNQKGWPELKTIEDLVKYRVIRRLPDAPDGKKWHLNAETMTVELK